MANLRLKHLPFTRLLKLERDIVDRMMHVVGQLQTAEGKRVYKLGTTIRLLRETEDKVRRELNRQRRTGRYR